VFAVGGGGGQVAMCATGRQCSCQRCEVGRGEIYTRNPYFDRDRA
jgi:hypothetical protein